MPVRPDRRPLGLAALILVGACVLVGACASPASDAALASHELERRARHFGRFERWARRSLLGEVRRGQLEALRETLFAPLRRDASVAGACVERHGSTPLVLCAPAELEREPPSGWTRLLHPRLGEVEVAVQAGSPGSLYVRRGPGADGVTVTVAYPLEGAGVEGETP